MLRKVDFRPISLNDTSGCTDSKLSTCSGSQASMEMTGFIRKRLKLLDSSGIYRITKDLLAAELTESRRMVGATQSQVLDDLGSWGPNTVLLERHKREGEHCLDLDSLERIAVASRINQFFRLHEWGVEDNLLRQQRIGDLAGLVEAVLLEEQPTWQRLTLLSSGTSGEPKATTHQRRDLDAEVAGWNQWIDQPLRVLSLVPSHHLYGLIWTVLWPSANGLEVLDASNWGPGRWQREVAKGDVIVGFPLMWEFLLRSVGTFPAGVVGISSAGALPPSLWDLSIHQGLSRMIEVYGSTETGGVAARENATDPFRLAPHWADRAEGLAELLPDHIDFESPTKFRILGRKDGAVKIGGSLVSLDDVARELRALDHILDCRVRRGGAGVRERLEALVVTDLPAAEYSQIEQRIHRELAQRLPAAALPKRLAICASLPVNAMGKVAQW